jgi:hypothetical protein
VTFQATRKKAELIFFEPISPYPLSAFRILFGVCVTATLILLHQDWMAWFGLHGWVSTETIHQAESGFRLNVFDLLPDNDGWIRLCFWIFLAASVCLVAGFCSRLSGSVVFLALNALNQRMPLILHGGDTFLRDASFFLAFSPCGAVCSLDALIRRRRGLPHPTKVIPWAQRLIQYQFVVIYACSFLWKIKGQSWRDGTALFYVWHLRELQRFPVPSIFRANAAIHLESWAVMIFELGFPLLIWFKSFRAPLLIAGLTFHLTMEYALNIPMFQWDMISAYVLFVDPDSFERRINLLSKPFKRWFGRHA